MKTHYQRNHWNKVLFSAGAFQQHHRSDDRNNFERDEDFVNLSVKMTAARRERNESGSEDE